MAASDPLLLGIVLGGAFAIMLGGGIWIAVALAGVGYLGMALFTTVPPAPMFGQNVWGASVSWSLTALPMFIWMGEILFRSRMSEDMFRGLAPWMGALPGRLLHCNVFGCGIFAAISGSSAATAATIGKITIPELRRRGYDDYMLVGSLAGSGTLGLLIPPSIIMIVYGVAAQVSIARLFVAGILPGVFLMLLFSAVIVVWAVLNPFKTPPRDPPVPFGERLWESRRLIPVVLLILTVIGTIYGGVATPTEAAVLGVVGSLVLAVAGGGFTWTTFVQSLAGATRTSCMIGFILAGAAFLTTAMGFTGVPRMMAEGITALKLPPGLLIAALTLLFIVMGCFLDGISMVVLTAAVILPTVEAAGIDLLWFGIFIVLVVEMAQVTPPVGFNLYILQSLTGRDMFYVGWAALPFFLAMVMAVAVIYFIPGIVTFLPNQMFGVK